MAVSYRSARAVRNAWQTLSIRARLVILALLTVVPLMFDRVRLLEASRAERIEQAAAEAQGLARRGAQGQRELVTTVRSLLQVMGRAYANMLAHGETCNLYLADLTSGMGFIRGMAIVGPDGRIKCSSFPGAVGLDLSDRDYYRESLATREFVLSNYLIGRTRFEPTIMAAYPTQAIDPNVEAVIIASVDLQSIRGLVGQLVRRNGAVVLLVDGNGTIVTAEPDPQEWAGHALSNSELLGAIRQGGDGSVRATGPDGVRRIFGFARTPLTDAHVVVGFNEAEVLQRVEKDIALAYVQLGFFGLLVLLVAWFGGERMIVRPIRSLARTAARLGRGDLDVRAAQGAWAQEFRPLATAINDMAQKLAERDHELREANRHLEELASIDWLSGLANRRGFDARLRAEWQRAGKLGRPVALMMIDVDQFKQFNDQYGHLEGDICLRRIGKLLMEAVEGEDELPARYGGEEFALLMPCSTLDEALAVGERLRRKVEELCIAHPASPCGQVTISVGAAAMIPALGEHPERLVEAADAGLYSAKRRGRNTVVAHAPVVLAHAS